MNGIQVFTGVLIVATSILGSIALGGGHVQSYFNIESLLILSGGLLFGSFAIKSFAHNFKLMTGGASGEFSSHDAFHYLHSVGRSVVTVGVAGVVLGIIHVMENLSTPDYIGPGLAMAFISLFYATVAYLVFDGLSQRQAIDGIERSEKIPDSDQTPVLHMGFAAVLLLLVTFIILYALNLPTKY